MCAIGLSRRRRGKLFGNHKGAVTVELAVIAPVLVTIVFGMVETSRIYEIQNLMSLASREGARVAAMDREDLLLEGQTTNGKVTADIENYLNALGFEKEHIDVQITHADSSTAFDLDDEANEFELFRIRVEVPYCETCDSPLPGLDKYIMSASITFRNGRVPNAD
jgi:Flp pilus assembly protein TadG